MDLLQAEDYIQSLIYAMLNSGPYVKLVNKIPLNPYNYSPSKKYITLVQQTTEY